MKASPELVYRRPVSPVDRVSVSWAGNLEFKLRPGHQLRSLKTVEIILAAIKTLSHFRWSCNSAVTLSRWPCLLHPNKSVERRFQESLTFFQKCRCLPSVMVYLTGAVKRLVGWGEITHGLKRLNSALFYMPTSDLTSLFPPQFSPWLQLAPRPPLFLSFYRSVWACQRAAKLWYM